tara:strand:- start:2998 stop:4182 length:1185 start_codon:yes stop_codon:yes gene_type:complete
MGKKKKLFSKSEVGKEIRKAKRELEKNLKNFSNPKDLENWMKQASSEDLASLGPLDLDMSDPAQALSKMMAAVNAPLPYDPETLADGSVKANKVPDESGLMNTGRRRPFIVFNRAPGEQIFPGPHDPAQVVIGNDRPASKASGYGGLGSNIASSIDMVVGRLAGSRKGEGQDDGTVVGNDYATDAARITISQLTDMDKNFGIAEGISGVQSARSGVGIKADGVRVIGREGVKIVTGGAQGFKGLGPSGETNTLGGKIQPAPTIELIAGNVSDPTTVFGGLGNTPEQVQVLQGVAKGENVAAALRELGEIVDELWSATFQFMMAQMVFNAGLAPCLAPLPGAAVMAGVAAGVSTSQMIYSMNPLYQTRNNKTIWEANYLLRTGYRFIESRNVFST